MIYLLTNDFVEIEFDEKFLIFRVNHFRPMLNEEFYELLDIKLAFMKTLKIKYPFELILVDAKKIGPMCPETITYSTNYYEPKLLEIGIKKFAFLQPNNIFAQVNITDFVDNPIQILEKKIFFDESDAIKWLKS